MKRKPIYTEKQVAGGRSILLRLFGNITRDPQDIRQMSDDAVVFDCTRAGYRWDERRETWVDVAIESAKKQGATTSEIWGN